MEQIRSHTIARLTAFIGFVALTILCVVACTPSDDVGGLSTTARPPATASTQPAAASQDEELLVAAHKLGFRYPTAPKESRPVAEVTRLNTSCVNCHGEYANGDTHTMHASSSVSISCVDCHGGNPNVPTPAGIKREANPVAFDLLKNRAHVLPRQATRELWTGPDGKLSSANPVAPAAATLKESPDFIRFVNPGDLRAARAACASCHNTEKYDFIHDKVEKNMMAHGAMLWNAALYNNGAHNRKDAIYGEAYTIAKDKEGHFSIVPALMLVSKHQSLLPKPEDTRQRGWLAGLMPLTRFEVTQPGNILRVFEDGGAIKPNLGVPDPLNPPGKPDVKLSTRGLGTELRTDPVFLGLQKTRLLDPTLNMFGTNDHPGDYRASGCTACHVVYANDRSPVHSGIWAKYGNQGKADPEASDKQIPKSESGHPIRHAFVPGNSIPTSSCIVCHVHPGTNVVNAYLGFTWWDNEMEGDRMYPGKQKYPTSDQEAKVNRKNPEGSAPRGLWSNLYAGEVDHHGDPAPADFLSHTGTDEFNAKLKHTQFADFHPRGWVFRAVFKRDPHGNLLDASGEKITDVSAAKMKRAIELGKDPAEDAKLDPKGVPVHLKDIHLEKGMHCIDCHFQQDVHGDGKIYGETRAAVTVQCEDCHGTTERPANILQYLRITEKNEDDLTDDEVKKKTTLKDGIFSGNAANPAATDFNMKMARKFTLSDGKLVQESRVTQEADGSFRKWEVKQTADDGVDRDGLDDAEKKRLERALYAHTVRRDGKTWGAVPAADEKGDLALAHSSSTMSCYACHTSWNTSCFGCHLPMKANQRKEMLHNEGLMTRNYTNYNFQTIRDDVYMLGKDSTITGNKIVPVRSACAVLVSSQDANRQWLYTQQQTISAEGFAGTAFSPYFPHTVRTIETKQCTDCHVSKANDNNAILSQLLLQGTKSVNFIGRFAWVACADGGLRAVAVTERDEPQAVIGSRLHEWAYPDFFRKHQAAGQKLAESYEHSKYRVNDVQLRGEYLYAACGPDGFIAFDVANIDNKGFSERIITAPVSALGQRLFVKTKNATSVCSPSTLALDPTRPRRPENEEGPISPLYAFIYVTDSVEGLVVVGNRPGDKNGTGVATLLDGDPDNNFISKALAFNPGGRLNGARHMRLHGHYAYVACDAGIVVVDLSNPLEPKLVDTPQLASLKNARKVFFQFRYAFVLDAQGLKVLDVTMPDRPKLVTGAAVSIADARDIYVTRTYGYVAAGREGLAIIDLEKPESPRRVNTVKEGLVDSTAVRVGMTNSSLYAYVADGAGGLKVLQLTGADERDGTPTFLGFTPMPKPRLIAHYPTHGPAVSLSEGLDRDRAVDEAGNQLAVFGRRGSRPFNLAEMQKLYLKGDGANRTLYHVDNTPTQPPLPPEKKED